MENLDKIWITGDKLSDQKRLKLYKTIVNPVPAYNCGTWRPTKKGNNNLTVTIEHNYER